jgi:predicted DNA binding CopG/RHH family protein
MYINNRQFEWDPRKAEANLKKHGITFEGENMKKNQDDDLHVPEFDFSRARRITPTERRMYRQALKNTFGVEMPRRGRPEKEAHLKYQDIHIKIHPKALLWAKSKAKKKGVGYQTIINEVLLKQAA